MFESLYACIGIGVIFFLGFSGALTPSVLGKFCPKYGLTRKYYFSFFNGIAAGVILAVGIIHSLADAQGAFTSISSLQGDSLTDQYPWNLWIMLMAILLLFMVEEILEFLANRFGIIGFDAHGFLDATAEEGKKKTKEKEHVHAHDDHACNHTPEEHKANDGECDAQPLEELCDHHDHEAHNSHSSSSDDDPDQHDNSARGHSSSSEDDDHQGQKAQQKQEDPEAEKDSDDDNDDDEEEDHDDVPASSGLTLVLKMIVVFVGLCLHNIFVGLTLGIADNDYVLFVALIFHQFFEGLGMGARVAMANLRHIATVLAIDFMFAAIPVIFIAIGIGIKSSLAEAPDSTDGYNIAKGTLQGLSGGVLVYVAIMHMMRAYKDNGATGWPLELHRLSSFFGLLFGAAVMSVIGIWA